MQDLIGKGFDKEFWSPPWDMKNPQKFLRHDIIWLIKAVFWWECEKKKSDMQEAIMRLRISQRRNCASLNQGNGDTDTFWILTQQVSLISWIGKGHVQCSSVGKESACSTGDLGSLPGLGRSPGEENGNPPTPIILPGESHGPRSLAGFSPWDHKCRTRLID